MQTSLVEAVVVKVDLRALVRAPKRILNDGEWKAGVMPRTAFPLSRSGNKAYRLGNRRWRVVLFEALGLRCRMLIQYHPGLGQYQASWGVEHEGDIKVVAQLEYHPTHGGWHVHACCSDIADVPAGIRRGPWNKLLHGRGTRHRMAAPTSDDSAFQRAMLVFGVDRRGQGGLL
jgi:hypothetical protein